jgi:2-C-methyl-D-erythritol 4-phosphate cytidylyltransferase
MLSALIVLPVSLLLLWFLLRGKKENPFPKGGALILLAGGRGSRMGSDTPKQFMEIAGRPLIWYALDTMQRSELIDECILVCGEADTKKIRDIVSRYGFDKVTHIVKGGSERYESVINGVMSICGREGECESAEGLPEVILIHDGARPFLTDDIIERCLDEVEETGGCVAAVPSKDTVKIAGDDRIVTDEPVRKNVWCMQTPQVFRTDIIKDTCIKVLDAKQKDEGSLPEITDDAQMVRTFTETDIKLVMGSYENIKVTTPEDMIVAERILEAKRGYIS